MQNTNIIILDGYLEALQIEDVQMLQEVEILVEKFSLGKATNLMKEAIPKARKILKGYGISGEAIEKKGKAAGAKLHTYFKQGKKPEDISKIIMKSAFKSLKAPITKIKTAIDMTGEEEMGPGKKIAVSVACFVLILFMNGFLTGIAITVFGPELGMLLLVVVMAPMVEEAFKNYFIQKGMPMLGTAVVFGLELVMYVMRMTAMGMSLPKLLIVRVITLGMHFATTMIQKYMMDKADPNDMEEMAKYAFAAWTAGVAVHITWNIFAVVYNNDITAWMK